MLENPPWVCPAVRSPEEHDSLCGFENTSEMGFALATSAGSAQQLLDDNSAKTMHYEEKRSRRLYPTVSLEGDQKVPGNISDCIAARRLASPMSDTGIVPIG